ncbi:hypothetical protein PSEUBRA_003265 [Kalmanozyma brasiliensis GHG001]|uniref:uncharacterized protein n=1 Tax=Kalmanozyma brasiliensis (strain GHG001) TaxID=1365824 RepID=UPI002867C6E3|nr:uncharacterized protein PSEUBRA_003265 [Kalmanozyma brasiliensis GHG001]KAF6767211.1 hypothetical protein PSEUBRA_003265 [Kalmanozyma brasiliensis GHG001]
MQQVCPDCGSQDASALLAEIGQRICSMCGYISNDLQFYEPTDVLQAVYELGRRGQHIASDSAQLAPVASFWSNDPDHKHQVYALQRKSEVDAHTLGTLNKLGSPSFFEQVDFLFQRAKNESWKRSASADAVNEDNDSDVQDVEALLASSSTLVPASLRPRRVRWGSGSLHLATACCYAVLRRAGVRIDLETVSHAAQLPSLKVRAAFRHLRLLVKEAVRNVKLANPDVYLRRIVAFFRFHLRHRPSSALHPTIVKFLSPLGRSSANSSREGKASPVSTSTSFEAIEATALDLCALWWPDRPSHPAVPAPLAAFASIVLAMEAHLKASAPIFEIFRCTKAALQFNSNVIDSEQARGHGPSGDATMSKNAVVYYKELCAALNTQAAKIPWLFDAAPVSKKRRERQRLVARAGERASIATTTNLARLDVIVHALDILDVWRSTHSSESRDVTSKLSTSHFRPVDPYRPNPSTASFRSAGEVGAEHATDQEEMNKDELDCFLSTSRDQAPSESDGGSSEVWSRVRRKLEAAGLLDAGVGDDGRRSSAHPLDALTDAQVDELLFDVDEMASLLRTDPTERSDVERAKIAAGVWPATFEHERNAEIAALARSMERQSPPAQAIKIESYQSVSSPESASSSSRRRSKRGKGSSATVKTELTTHPESRAQSQKRTRIKPFGVSLREQLDESDWSE